MILLQILFILFPWKIRRYLLKYIFDWSIDRTSYIGYSLIRGKVVLKPHSRIGNFNFIRVNFLGMGDSSSIGNFNYIYSINTGGNKYFRKSPNATPGSISLEDHSAITSRHNMDVTFGLYLGSFSTIAGIGTNILSHSVDLKECIQTGNEVRVGRYCWISTNCIVLNGVSIGDYSIVAAGAVVKGIIPQESLYLNVGDIRKVSKEDYEYMSRNSGYIW